jgi:hypothetical protein
MGTLPRVEPHKFAHVRYRAEGDALEFLYLR